MRHTYFVRIAARRSLALLGMCLEPRKLPACALAYQETAGLGVCGRKGGTTHSPLICLEEKARTLARIPVN